MNLRSQINFKKYAIATKFKEILTQETELVVKARIQLALEQLIIDSCKIHFKITRFYLDNYESELLFSGNIISQNNNAQAILTESFPLINISNLEQC